MKTNATLKQEGDAREEALKREREDHEAALTKERDDHDAAIVELEKKVLKVIGDVKLCRLRLQAISGDHYYPNCFPVPATDYLIITSNL